TISKPCSVLLLKYCKLSTRNTSASSHCNTARLRRRLLTALVFASIATPVLAPRDNASRNSAPLPVKASSTRAPWIVGASQLNSVSRTRSGVGRKPGASGTVSLRERHSPPMIRMELARALCVGFLAISVGVLQVRWLLSDQPAQAKVIAQP